MVVVGLPSVNSPDEGAPDHLLGPALLLHLVPPGPGHLRHVVKLPGVFLSHLPHLKTLSSGLASFSKIERQDITGPEYTF